jgi:excisionase family DNA binding protein
MRNEPLKRHDVALNLNVAGVHDEPLPLLRCNVLKTYREAAEYLRCSVTNIRQLVDRGALAVVPTGANGKGFKIEQSEIDRFISERRVLRGRDANRFSEKCKPIKLKHLR